MDNFFKNFDSLLTNAEDINNILPEKNINSMKQLILNGRYSAIGETVQGGNEIPSSTLDFIYSVSRRKIEKKSVLVVVFLDYNQDGKEGVAFTEDSIFSWLMNKDEKSEMEFIIKYSDIRDVDFEDDTVIISLKDGSTKEIIIDTDEDELDYYSDPMYHFIMDIVDYYNENEKMIDTMPQQNKGDSKSQKGQKNVDTKNKLDEEDILAKIEKMADLKEKGILSEEEFISKKTELLSRL